MSKGSPGLREAVRTLRKHYGPPTRPSTTDPFELILWENVAYLAPPSHRREAYEQLVRTVGTDPTAILAAKDEVLEAVTARGILKSEFAAKLRECATIAIQEFGGDLDAAVRGPLATAKKALRSFPGIGEPGAEKILLFAGRQALLAPESNGLRVLVRLGLVPEKGSYARTYAASREVAEDLPQKPAVLQDAHLLLRQHGQTLCTRGAPRCRECPLASECPYAVASQHSFDSRSVPTRARQATPSKPASRPRARR